jgi:hypothetical protein
MLNVAIGCAMLVDSMEESIYFLLALEKRERERVIYTTIIDNTISFRMSKASVLS